MYYCFFRQATQALVVPLIFICIVCAQNEASLSRHLSLNTPGLHRFVILKLTLSAGGWMRAIQREGELIRVEQGESIFLFTTQISDEGRAAVSVQVYRKSRNQPFVGATADSERVQFYGSLVEFERSNPPFMVEVEKITKRVKDDDSTSKPYLASQKQTCCVSCNGVKTCACAVTATCGSCCIGVCCD